MRRGEGIVVGLFCAAVLGEAVRRDLARFAGSEELYEERLPADAPTQSLEAAKAFKEGNRDWGFDIRSAIAAYSRALELDPDFDEALANRALAWAIAGEEKSAFDDLEQLRAAGSDLADSLEVMLRQEFAATYAMEGQSALYDGDPHWAIDRFTQALVHSEDDPVILSLRAEAYERLGRQPDATADQQRAQASHARGTASVLVQADEP
jgi:tetratricopeptide (TPR) repeat protein